MTADSFEKAKKGMRDTAKGIKDTVKGVEDTSEGVHETAGGVNETAEGVIEGVKDTAERVIKGVKDTVKGAKEGVEQTAEGVKDTAEEVVDTNTHSGSDDERENREYNESGSKEPMNPEDIAEHEPTAVKRDLGTDIADEGQTGTDSPEAREKIKKSGITEAK
jgi:ElaB/YqjD/DUF883 family membrane-anchored ribosome-binding protein